MTLYKECHECGRIVYVNVDVEMYTAWIQGKMFIQKALPKLTKDQRDILVTGICGNCNDLMVANQRYLNV